MPTNNFKAFAGDIAANVISQADYEALTALVDGFVAGVASSDQLNKVWRQSSIMSAVLAQFIVDQTGQDALDDGTTATLLANLKLAAASAVVLRGYFNGFTMSTAGGSGTMVIAAGQAADSSNAALMTLAAAINKTTAAWAVGTNNGGLDTGVIANSTFYYFYVIRRPDTGVVDVIFSLSSAAPALPASYTQYRRVGAGKIDGAGHWFPFTQANRDFYWASPMLDFSGAGATTAALLACTVPSGYKVRGIFNVEFASVANSNGTYISDPASTDLAPSNTGATPLGSLIGASAAAPYSPSGQVSCWTNTSAQIRHRELGTTTMYIATLGWNDPV